MMVVAYSWGQMMMLAIPPDDFWGINFRYLDLLVPFAVALGEHAFVKFIIHLFMILIY